MDWWIDGSFHRGPDATREIRPALHRPSEDAQRAVGWKIRRWWSVVSFWNLPILPWKWVRNGGIMEESGWTWMRIDELCKTFLLFKIHDVTLAFLDCRLEAYLLRQWPTYVRTWPSTNRRVLQISDARLKMVNPDAGVSAWRVSARLTSWFGWRTERRLRYEAERWNGMNGSQWMEENQEIDWRHWVHAPVDSAESRWEKSWWLTFLTDMPMFMRYDVSDHHLDISGHLMLHCYTIFWYVLSMYWFLSPSNHKAMRKWLEPWCRFVIQICDRCGWAFLRFLAKGEVLKEGCWGSGSTESTVRSSVFLLLKDFGDAFFVGNLREISTDFLLSASRRSVHFGEARHQDMCRLLWWLLPMSMLGAAKGFKAPGWTQQSGKMKCFFNFFSGTIRMYLSTGHHMTNNIIII